MTSSELTDCIFCCRKPCLILKLQASFSIRLIPAVTPEALPLAKLAPERNSLRLATAAAMPATAASAKGQKRKREDAPAVNTKGEASHAGTESSGDAARLLPTPQYNTSIVGDMSMERHQQVLQSAFEAVPRLREAVVLLKVRSCAAQIQATACFAASQNTAQNYQVVNRYINSYHKY